MARKKKEVEKIGLRDRFHYWCCDRLGITSIYDFYGFAENVDKYILAQDKFNRLVGEKLHLQIKTDKNEIKRSKEDKMNEEESMKRMFG